MSNRTYAYGSRFIIIIIVVVVAGSRGFVEEIEFYTDVSFHDGSALCGFLGPGPQGGDEAPVQGFVGCAAPLAKPFCTQVKNS